MPILGPGYVDLHYKHINTVYVRSVFNNNNAKFSLCLYKLLVIM